MEFFQLPASPYLWAGKFAAATGRRLFRLEECAAQQWHEPFGALLNTISVGDEPPLLVRMADVLARPPMTKPNAWPI